MKKILLLLLSALIVALFLALPLTAEEWVLDPNHSKLKFAIDARMIGAEGIFRSYKVKADINDKELEQSKIEMMVDVASIDTNSEKRDAHLRSKDFFDVANFPTAEIKVAQVRKLGASDYEGDGTITIRGVTKPVKLPAHILLMEGGILRFRGTITVNRQDFGVSYNSTMNKIEDMATITYELNLRKPRGQGGPGAPPKTPPKQ
jgi:polyisoprenoid-binding protein YceI